MVSRRRVPACVIPLHVLALEIVPYQCSRQPRRGVPIRLSGRKDLLVQSPRLLACTACTFPALSAKPLWPLVIRVSSTHTYCEVEPRQMRTSARQYQVIPGASPATRRAVVVMKRRTRLDDSRCSRNFDCIKLPTSLQVPLTRNWAPLRCRHQTGRMWS